MFHQWTRDEFVISTDPARLNVGVIHEFLRHSYWAQNIPREVVERAIENSLVFGLYEREYEHERQIGFARVVTDRATFAYLCDVFVVEKSCGRGLGQWLVHTIMSHPEAQGLRQWLLATHDAHTLYAKFGFTGLQNPERLMQIVVPDIYVPAKGSP